MFWGKLNFTMGAWKQSKNNQGTQNIQGQGNIIKFCKSAREQTKNFEENMGNHHLAGRTSCLFPIL